MFYQSKFQTHVVYDKYEIIDFGIIFNWHKRGDSGMRRRMTSRHKCFKGGTGMFTEITEASDDEKFGTSRKRCPRANVHER